MSGSKRVWGWSTRLFVMSAASAIAVSVIYLPQSLLTDLASSLGVSTATAGIVATTVSSGYAIGIFFLVPLSDRVQPQRQLTIQILVLTAALLASAALPEVASVAIGFLAVGLVANIAQLVIPVAGKLAPAGRRGATTGALVGALLIGIFGGRVVASILVGTLGWRLVVVVFAVLVLATLPFLRRAIGPGIELSRAGTPYGRLLLSTIGRVRTSPALVQSAIMTFLTFATFNSVWTVMVVHLTSPLFGWTVLQAGLFGLVGLAAGIITPFGGRFIDRFGPMKVNGFFYVVLLVAAVAIIVDSRQIWLFGITTFLLTWANQSIQSSNQSRVLQANPDAPAQANTVFMVGVFLGGSIGAYLGPVAFAIGGMSTVGVLAVVLVCLSIVTWVFSYRYESRHTPTLEGQTA